MTIWQLPLWPGSIKVKQLKNIMQNKSYIELLSSKPSFSDRFVISDPIAIVHLYSLHVHRHYVIAFALNKTTTVSPTLQLSMKFFTDASRSRTVYEKLNMIKSKANNQAKAIIFLNFLHAKTFNYRYIGLHPSLICFLITEPRNLCHQNGSDGTKVINRSIFQLFNQTKF